MKFIQKALGKIYGSTEKENENLVLSRLLEVKNSAKFLDCGCGDGHFTQQIAKKIGTSRIYGVEVPVATVEGIREREEIEVYYAGLNVCYTDLNERLPFEDETFDVITANQVIEHLYNTDTFITEVWRVLKAGGYAVISTPNMASLHIIASLTLGFQPMATSVSDKLKLGNPLWGGIQERSISIEHPKHAHLRLFTRPALKELFEYYGFRIEKMIPVGYYPFVGKIARFMSRLDGNHSVYLSMKVRKIK